MRPASAWRWPRPDRRDRAGCGQAKPARAAGRLCLFLIFAFESEHCPFSVFESEAGDVHPVFAAFEVLVAQVKGKPDFEPVLWSVGDFGPEGVDPAFDQDVAENAGTADEVLLGLGIESGGGAALSDAVPHRDRLTPDGGGVADQFAELVDVELFSDGFGMGDEVLNFLLHGMVLSFWGGFPPLAFIVIFLP